MANKHRKKGDWEKEAASRRHKQYEMRTTRGLTNSPPFGEVGSAAYRRLLASQQQGRRRG